ncbi:MAG: DUF4190 domain-containing protein [Alistipes sp.]|nr:DUF4190 domain-containing protein [Alistipes sp.]
MNSEGNIYEGTILEENFRPNNTKIWASVTSLVLGIISLVLCCCCPYLFLLSVASIVFGIIALVQGMSGKGMAIAGIAISSVVLIIALLLNLIFGAIIKDLTKLSNEPQYYVEMYEETGEVPEEFQKYCDPKYDKYWDAMNIDGFDTFYGMLMDELEKNFPSSKSSSRNSSSDRKDSGSSESRSGSGELPVDL